MSKLSENLTASEDAESLRHTPQFSPEQRRLLLAIAHEAITLRLAAKPFPDWRADWPADWRASSGTSNPLSDGPSSSNAGSPGSAEALWAALEGPRGVFTTLYLQGALRGCVGYVAPIRPLYDAVAESACAAAFEDSRFWPLTPEEAPALKISLSVLSELFPIEAAQVEVGRHGLVISDGMRRGLLLPQVPVEHGWDRVTFLEQTCRKAGLPTDAWQRKSATIEAFEAEVFADDGAPA